MMKIRKLGFLFLAVMFLACSGDDDSSTTTPPEEKTCADALVEVQQAQDSYNASMNAITCNMYKAKLQQQQQLCGDVGGVIQDIIDQLNCAAN